MTRPDSPAPRGQPPMRPGQPASHWLRVDAWLTRLRPHRVPLALAIDAGLVALAWQATYLFRLGFERWWSARPGYDGWVLLGVVALYLLAFVLLRVPHGVWRFTGFGEAQRIALACVAAGAASAAAVMGLRLYGIPRSVLALHPLAALVLLCGARLAYRMLYEHVRVRIAGASGQPLRRALVLGAGGAANRLLAGILTQGWQVVGLLDDDAAKHGTRLGGATVRGPLDAVALHAAQADATHVLIALPNATRAQRQRAVELARTTGLVVLTVPRADELLSERDPQPLRGVQPEDLLGRDPVRLDETPVGEALRGQVVMVTGAGGSIGAELCRQVARFAPARLVLLEISEYNLYAIEQVLHEAFPALAVAALIADVKDPAQLARALAAHRPQVLLHAAAYKHVPLMEGANAWAALANNALGTLHAARAAAAHGVGRFVLISTDKAVNPTNVMGASKRVAELVVARLAALHPGTRFIAVRFGNVLGSSGSVIPRFAAQIARGGPVTVTHPDIIRYFMTIPEAARLVLQAGAIGESGQVLVLDMGEPVRIAELARTMIRLAGRSEAEVPIVYSGLRPGEKLYEELLASDDTTVATAVPRLRLARLAREAPTAQGVLEQLEALDAAALDEGAARALLQALVPEFRAPPASAAG